MFYIGKGTNGRTRPGAHATPSSLRQDDKNNRQKAARIRELIALFPDNPCGYTIRILEELPAPHKGASPEERLTHATALGLLERQHIRWARLIGWKILNLTDGGENVVGPMIGRKGEACPNFGKRHTNETKKRISRTIGQQHAGTSNGFFGRHHTDETKKKNAEAHIGKQHSIETRTKMSATRTGKSIKSAKSSRTDSERKQWLLETLEVLLSQLQLPW